MIFNETLRPEYRMWLKMCHCVCSLPRRKMLNVVKGKVWNYLLTKKDEQWDDRL